MVEVGKRPSDARRISLADSISVPTVSNFFPLERYYEAAATVFTELRQTHQALQQNSLQEQYDADFNKVLDICYVYGKRYCHFVFDAIPQHNYYGTPKYKNFELQHKRQVQHVVSILEDVAEKMDQQEAFLEQMREQERKEQDRRDQLKLEQWQRDLQQQKSQHSSKMMNGSTVDVEQSAMEKLRLLQQPSVAVKPSSTRFQFVDDSGESDADTMPSLALSVNGITPLLPPSPLLPPPQDESTPPSYDAVVQGNRPLVRPLSRDNDGSEQRIEQPLPRKEKAPKITSMRQLQSYYKEVYQKCQQNGKITIQSIDTYQGRLSESTNGCTVISALVAAQHLEDPTPGTCISNGMIQQVIDQRCGPILRTIRRKLGLGGHALIIPSDVHDHLVDAKILHQEHFAGAAGGNIMDPKHYGEFLKLLTSNATEENSDKVKKSNGKAGATLFFREHVISIVKFTDPATGQVCFDLVDSMPGILYNGKSMATRTRCRDIRSLELLLLWYASRKFSDANCSYIDRNAWDDSMADLDPRVFQGFVWST